MKTQWGVSPATDKASLVILLYSSQDIQSSAAGGRRERKHLKQGKFRHSRGPSAHKFGFKNGSSFKLTQPKFRSVLKRVF
jgi:hypothetical protein